MLYDNSCVLSETRSRVLFGLSVENAVLANNLYNAAMFRIRQIFCGYDKEERTANEALVFEEVEKAQAECRVNGKPFKIRRVISYSHLEKLMRCTKNPDFFAGLPMQTAQHVLKEAVRVFRAWLNALKDYRKDPSRYTGKPRMPHYLSKNGRHTYAITNQDCVLMPVYKEDGKPDGVTVKFPGTKERLRLKHIPHSAALREVKVVPWYRKFILHLIIEDNAPPVWPDMPNKAGLDFGTDNIAAIACTDGTSAVCKGGAVLCANRDFAKEKARLVSILAKGHKDLHYSQTERLAGLSRKHDRFVYDQAHKITSWVVRFCVEHRAGVLVVGVNKGWKQRFNMGKVNDQNFTGIPHSRLRSLLSYKCMVAGITYVEQEESYTSKADITAMDYIPTYGKDDWWGKFLSGERVKRGQYLCSNGLLINADCNGAANILRKAIPGAWAEMKDFSFLARPQKVGFKDLNKRRRVA